MHESSRGWRLDKQHKIDVVVALSMAALAAIRGVGEYAYNTGMDWVRGPDPVDNADAQAAAAREFQEMRFNRHVLHHSGYRRW
jgi:hypothetical protein